MFEHKTFLITPGGHSLKVTNDPDGSTGLTLKGQEIAAVVPRDAAVLWPADYGDAALKVVLYDSTGGVWDVEPVADWKEAQEIVDDHLWHYYGPVPSDA